MGARQNFPDLGLLQSLVEVLGASVSELLGIEQDISEGTIAVISAISLQEKRAFKKALYEFVILAMPAGVLYLFFFWADCILLDYASDSLRSTLRQLLLTLSIILITNGAFVLRRPHK